MFCEVCAPNIAPVAPAVRRVMARFAAAVVASAVVIASAACGGKARPPARLTDRPAPTVLVGACGQPERDGVVGDSPRPRRADRDLDGDGSPELVVADRALCTAEGNCWWNVFHRDDGAGCSRYAGTVAAASLEPLSSRGDDGFADVRGTWNLSGAGRTLVQDYRYIRGGYQVVDALLCRRENDDRLLCTEDER
jgi:hypothetical protein